MPTSLFQYEMLPTTWFYISALMLLATFYRFNRFISIRNLDIVTIILFTPGLLCIAMGTRSDSSITSWGYIWLAFFGFFAFVRTILDCFMVRRPLLEPNLALSSVIFSLVTLLGFMTINIMVNRGEKDVTPATLRLEQILTMQESIANRQAAQIILKPGYQPFLALTRELNQFQAPPPVFWEEVVANSDSTRAIEPILGSVPRPIYKSPPKAKSGDIAAVLVLGPVILIQWGIVIVMILIGLCHFGNIKTGIAAAMFYLLLPYVSQMTGAIDHSFPGLLIVLALLFYRRPVVSGALLATAAGLVFYPIFLLPLWGSFYFRRGLLRFLLGSFSVLLAMALLLLLSPESLGSYPEQLVHMFGYHSIRVPVYDGLWAICPTIYRLPIIALFGVFWVGLMIWPGRKNLATLIACSALLMIGVQFWIGNQGGLYMAWYMPLLILTIFRPNLEDRVATTTVIDIRV